MRPPAHERPGGPLAEGFAPSAVKLADRGQPRRCILTGQHGPRAMLVRLVQGPDGSVWPDLGARLPGRGAWVTGDRALVAEAVARGTLARALARSWRQKPPAVPADLAARIGEGLERRLLDRLGLEHRAGRLLLGAEKIAAAARAGRLQLLLHAADAAADGVARLEQALRAGSVGAGPPAASVRLPVGRERLSRALGRDNMVHVGIKDGRAAARVANDLARLVAYMRPADGQVASGPNAIVPGRHRPAAACAGEHEDEGSE